MKNLFALPFFNSTARRLITTGAVLVLAMMLASVVAADVPGRAAVRGTVPNPGTQQQELGNITFPAPYNVFEFVVTCAGCHGGSIDHSAGHFANWAGTSMASSARDPIFRANQIGVNETILALTGKDGAGNMCMRCHSPNGWYSGRFDPTLGGDPRGTTMIHSILLSTDDEGIMCEVCHRAIGNVVMKDPALLAADPNYANDPVWSMMAGLDDWPHTGIPFVDQFGDQSIAPGNPYGDTSLQLGDGMTYVGKYSGIVDIYASDIPLTEDPNNPGQYVQGGNYTGQTYGVYPQGWVDAQGNDVSGQPVVAADGSLPISFEAPVGPPTNPNGTYNYMSQSISLEHPTAGDRKNGLNPSSVPDANKFITSSEMCGSCHELTVPVLNHGMPEQRTYTEWKYSSFGENNVRCQDCHMPAMKQEYADNAAVSVNADPLLSGWFPYAKDRNAQGGTSFHKFAGANRDLPMMMKELYPEVDLEVLGAPTGNDPRIFPGMLSNRDSMWDRAQRNTEISLLESVSLQIVSGPTYDANTGKWNVQVKLVNNTGHRLPSGYPDGRRLFLTLNVKDANGAVVYESGYYDQEAATLYTDSSKTSFARATENMIDSGSNAVMVYERVTGTCDATSCNESPSLLNNKILFDNRIPPLGFDYAAYREAGVKFINYDAAKLPYEDIDRYASGQNYDTITYSFDAPADAVLSVRAEALWQTHTREFMEHLKTQDNSNVRPEGPPSIYEPNYPLVPNYLSDQINLNGMTDLDGNPLKDNWGGVAYGSWLLTGKGAPYLVAMDDSAVAAAPDAPLAPTVTMLEPFTAQIDWQPVPGAEGYLVWIRYGVNENTASWDKLAIVYDGTQLVNTAMSVGKTYAVKVEAFNSKGTSASPVTIFTTPIDLPLPAENLQVTSSTFNTITMSWIDAADNETGFIIERQDVPVIGAFYQVADIASPSAGFATGGVNFTDNTAQPGNCYNYRVFAYNASGRSTENVNGPVQGCTIGAPIGPITLTAVAATSNQVNLNWSGATGTIAGYRIERSTNGGATYPVVFNVANAAAASYSDNTVAPNTTYTYRVFAYNVAGNSPASNTATVKTPLPTPASPSNLVVTAPASFPPAFVTLTWTDNASNETGFIIERALEGGTFSVVATINTANITTFRDSTVAPKMTYVYRVIAKNSFGNSLPSAEVSVVTPGEIPQPPTQLRVRSVTKDQITLVWSDGSGNETGFYVERSLDGVTWVRIARLRANVTTFQDSRLRSNTTYWYRVQSFNTDGVSGWAGPVTAKTRAR